MKKRVAVAFCLAAAVLLPAVVRADLTVKEETRMDGIMGMLSSKGVETTYIKGEKMRAEATVEMGGIMAASPSDVVTITRLDKGLIWFVDNADSTYTEMSLAGSKAESSAAHFKVKDISINKTGRTKTIMGDKCEGVEVNLTIEASAGGGEGQQVQAQSVKSLFWMRPEVKDMAEMRRFWDAMVDVAKISQGSDPMSEVMAPVFAKIKEIPGVPLGIEMSLTAPLGEGGSAESQAEMQEAMKMLQQMRKGEGAPQAEAPSTPPNEIRVTRYVTSMSTGPLSDSLFEVPKSYRRVEGLNEMFPGPAMKEGD